MRDEGRSLHRLPDDSAAMCSERLLHDLLHGAADGDEGLQLSGVPHGAAADHEDLHVPRVPHGSAVRDEADSLHDLQDGADDLRQADSVHCLQAGDLYEDDSVPAVRREVRAVHRDPLRSALRLQASSGHRLLPSSLLQRPLPELFDRGELGQQLNKFRVDKVHHKS